MNLDERIKLIKKYQKYCNTNVPCRYGSNPSDLLKTCEKLKALGFEWGDKITFEDFKITKGFYISNSSTGYIPTEGRYYIQWDNGNVGAYQFTGNSDVYREVQEEYRAFKNKLMSYNPVDWDNLNDNIIFDIENGKKLIADYKNIIAETREIMRSKVNACKLKKAKEEYEKALADMGKAWIINE